jgi:ABC-type glycerol-3-phosphate transport system permease component
MTFGHVSAAKTIKRLSHVDRIIHLIGFLWILLTGIVVAYPLLYTLACSVSDPLAIIQGRVSVFPVGFNLDAYKAALSYDLIPRGFLNSLLYVIGCTTLSQTLIILAAYPMSRKDLPGRKLIQTFFVITMFFGGGLIPNFLLMRDLGLVGSPMAIIVGAGFSCWGMIVFKTYLMHNVPESLLDSAKMDGCGDARFLVSFVLPLSVPIIAVQVLGSAVGTWNGYFNAMIYLDKPETFPFALVLRQILFITQIPQQMLDSLDATQVAAMEQFYIKVRFAILIIGAAPMMVLYPFIQKFFIRGMLMGSVKE